MKPATLLMLKENLKNLKLANMFRHLESQIRQATADGLAYGDFLLELTEIELRIRSENRDKRRIREARFRDEQIEQDAGHGRGIGRAGPWI